ncbi:MAG: hypothetical protein ABT15_31215 [Pseudonocardia sp. SCN 73-27]|nr:MAG: hypothetical protein ABS80_24970 [Pseudonocardia sp. SCN 72-51]ODU99674.1 MAG: hypothetical protein ABT15_31215 [Pseudonocardia sp. SCN 73-27]
MRLGDPGHLRTTVAHLGVRLCNHSGASGSRHGRSGLSVASSAGRDGWPPPIGGARHGGRPRRRSERGEAAAMIATASPDDVRCRGPISRRG